MARRRTRKAVKVPRIGMYTATIRPAYTKKAGKKNMVWYDKNATYIHNDVYRRGID